MNELAGESFPHDFFLPEKSHHFIGQLGTPGARSDLGVLFQKLESDRLVRNFQDLDGELGRSLDHEELGLAAEGVHQGQRVLDVGRSEVVDEEVAVARRQPGVAEVPHDGQVDQELFLLPEAAHVFQSF